MHKHKNYFAIILAFGMFATTTGLVSLNAHAWNGQHHGQGTYHHTAMHGAYVTSAPQHLHRHADPDCPYYNNYGHGSSHHTAHGHHQGNSNGNGNGNGNSNGNGNGNGNSNGNSNGNGHHRNAAHAAHADCPYYNAN